MMMVGLMVWLWVSRHGRMMMTGRVNRQKIKSVNRTLSSPFEDCILPLFSEFFFHFFAKER